LKAVASIPIGGYGIRSQERQSLDRYDDVLLASHPKTFQYPQIFSKVVLTCRQILYQEERKRNWYGEDLENGKEEAYGGTDRGDLAADRGRSRQPQTLCASLQGS
jgi:hypothetical protein